jgi:hypothetical protein
MDNAKGDIVSARNYVDSAIRQNRRMNPNKKAMLCYTRRCDDAAQITRLGA